MLSVCCQDHSAPGRGRKKSCKAYRNLVACLDSLVHLLVCGHPLHGTSIYAIYTASVDHMWDAGRIATLSLRKRGSGAETTPVELMVQDAAPSRLDRVPCFHIGHLFCLPLSMGASPAPVSAGPVCADLSDRGLELRITLLIAVAAPGPSERILRQMVPLQGCHAG